MQSVLTLSRARDPCWCWSPWLTGRSPRKHRLASQRVTGYQLAGRNLPPRYEGLRSSVFAVSVLRSTLRCGRVVWMPQQHPVSQIGASWSTQPSQSGLAPRNKKGNDRERKSRQRLASSNTWESHFPLTKCAPVPLAAWLKGKKRAGNGAIRRPLRRVRGQAYHAELELA